MGRRWLSRGDKVGRTIVDVSHRFTERTFHRLDCLGGGTIAAQMIHHVDHVQVFPVDHLVPQLVSLRPVRGRELVRLDVQQVGSLEVQLIWYPGTVVVPVPRTIVVTIRVVEHLHERRVLPGDHDSSDELRRFFFAYNKWRAHRVTAAQSTSCLEQGRPDPTRPTGIESVFIDFKVLY